MKKDILYVLIEHKKIIYRACIVESDKFYRLNTKKGVIIAPSNDCRILKRKVIGKTNY